MPFKSYFSKFLYSFSLLIAVFFIGQTAAIAVELSPKEISNWQSRAAKALRSVKRKRIWNSNMRITAITAYDYGNLTTGTSSIDVIQTTCDDNSLEGFYDTILGVTVINDSPYILRFDTFSYVVKQGQDNGRAIRARRMSPAGVAEVQPNSSAEIYGLFIDAHEGGKRLVGQSELIPEGYGIKNVVVKFVGVNSNHETIRVRARTAISFDEFDRCD